jgi:hypothetical protein
VRFTFILIYIFKFWYVRRSYCLLPFDLLPQDACLQEIGDFIGLGQQERWYGGFEPRWRLGRIPSLSVLCRVMLVVEGLDFSTWTSKGFAVLQNDL